MVNKNTYYTKHNMYAEIQQMINWKDEMHWTNIYNYTQYQVKTQYTVSLTDERINMYNSYQQ